MTQQDRTQLIDKLHNQHPGTHVQLNDHGKDCYSITLYAGPRSKKIVAEYYLRDSQEPTQ